MCLKKSNTRENLRMPSMSSADLSPGSLESAISHRSHDFDWMRCWMVVSFLMLTVWRSLGGAIWSREDLPSVVSADLKHSTALVTKSWLVIGWREYRRTTKE